MFKMGISNREILSNCMILKSVLIIALSEEINLESGILLSSKIHLKDVNNVIKGIIIDDGKKDILDHNNDENIKQRG